MNTIRKMKNRGNPSNPPSQENPQSNGTLTNSEVEKHGMDNGPVKLVTPRIFAMVMIVSLGGFIFGYDTGQISGFLAMDNFLERFGDTTKNGKPAFSNVRSGTIVGLLSIGTLIGAVGAAPIANGLGRKIAIIAGNIIFIVGVIVQITTGHTWYQIAIGRWVAGLGVGMLSVLTPMYQSETAPRQVRGALVSAYQLFITLGILIAYCINLGTSKANGPDQWRIPMGVGFVWPVIMIAGILFLRESPRWDYRKGRIDRARATIAKSYNVTENHWEVHREMREIKAKFDAENPNGSKAKWHGVFTGPRMTYRVLLGIALQALQQLTGANFYFYFSTTVFKATGLSDSFVTSLILGAVNFGMTFPGLYVVEHFGRRKALITGSLWMAMTFIVFASLGSFSLDNKNPQNTPKTGAAMIVFACLFIAGYAPTWGPIIWAVIGETYPTRYRALAMGIATSSNWIWNFLISFFTPFITGAIGFKYGYIFAGCNLAGAVIVYFFLCETQGRSLEEIDTMYIMHIPPRQSSKWQPPPEDELVTADKVDTHAEEIESKKSQSPSPSDRF